MSLSSYRLAWTGDGWDAWLRALDGRSGVYVIKSRSTGAILYVGESHSGTLYDTITRHFQTWRGRTAGARYDRGSVVETTPARSAPDRQDALIKRLAPRDNTQGQTRKQDFLSGIRKTKPKPAKKARGWWRGVLPF